MSRSTVRVGTRGSALALAQSNQVVASLRKANPGTAFELVVIKTTGDRLAGVAELRNAGKGVFVKELEKALLARKIDAAIHSGKDLPGELPEGLAIGALPAREEAADAFVGRAVRQIDKLRAGRVLGTASLRRQAFLLAHWPGLEVEDLRGNLDTRLAKLRAPRGRYDGIVVAAAGLRRLYGENAPAHELLPKNLVVPAAAQGAIAIEIRASDARTRELLAPIHDEPTSIRVRAERELQRRLEGGCQLPLGVHAELLDDGLIKLTAAMALPDGSDLVQAEATGEAGAPEHVAEILESILRGRGIGEILDALRPSRPAKARKKAAPKRKTKKAKKKR